MNTIKILPQEVINFIAAGEIVESLSSIVKELIENSLDSQSKLIYVKLYKDYTIIVEDNGIGIDYKDLPMVFLQHSTSKANTLMDVINIETMGFRGEALWSISNVSQVEIISYYQGHSYQITNKFGNISNIIDHGPTNKQGVTITVSNIFDNIPVRKKFLKEFNQEYNDIVKIFQWESFCAPSIGFSLWVDDKIQLNYSIANAISRLEAINNNWHCILSQHRQIEDCQVDIIINYQKKGKFFISLNHRPIEDYKIKFFIKQQLEKLTHGPINFSGGIYIIMNPQDVDINIHPRKNQVKFRDSHLLFQTIKLAIDNHFNLVNEKEDLPKENHIDQLNYTNYNKTQPINLELPLKNFSNDKLFHKKVSNNINSLSNILSVKDIENSHSTQQNSKNIFFNGHNFLLVSQDKKTIIINKNLLTNSHHKPLESKLITLPNELLSHSQNWYQYNIKFSLVGENTIIAWEIPQDYGEDIIKFFKELETQWSNNQLELWLNQFNPWNDEKIIAYIQHNSIDDHWPLNYCSWIVE